MIEFIEISKLTLLENNPRRITKEQFDKLLKSLKEDPKFFELRPCLVNQVGDDLIVYAGNQRVRAALKLKWHQVPCIVEKDISKSHMDARVIKDNVTYGEFDYDILNASFDIDVLLEAGFTAEELTGDYGDLKEPIENPSEQNPEAKEKKQKECPQCGHLF